MGIGQGFSYEMIRLAKILEVQMWPSASLSKIVVFYKALLTKIGDRIEPSFWLLVYMSV